MTKGTPSMGKRQKKSHVACRRCGFISYNYHKRTCVHCGFGRSRRLRKYSFLDKY
ncbi:MAG: 50S ribosomal protein L37e [Halobacteriota archaeon]